MDIADANSDIGASPSRLPPLALRRERTGEEGTQAGAVAPNQDATFSDLLSPSLSVSDITDFDDIGDSDEATLSGTMRNGGYGNFTLLSAAESGAVTSPPGLPLKADEVAPTPQPEQRPLAKKHNAFYFRDDMVVFQVEDTLFRVHSFFFQRDSEFFRTLLANHGPASERNPVYLGGISIADFERFLGVLYPSHFSEHTASTVEEWTSILALATEWSFQTIRTLAIRELFPLASPVDKIVVGNRYGIPAWLKDAYVAVCARASALTDEEGEGLGLKEVIKISQMRQDVGRQGLRTMPRSEVEKVVNAASPESLKDIAGDSVGISESLPSRGSAVRGTSNGHDTTSPSTSIELENLNAQSPEHPQSPHSPPTSWTQLTLHWLTFQSSLRPYSRSEKDTMIYELRLEVQRIKEIPLERAEDVQELKDIEAQIEDFTRLNKLFSPSIPSSDLYKAYGRVLALRFKLGST